MNLSEVLNSINYNKEDLFQDLPDVTTKEYVAFIVNKSFSYFPDTILQANEMNLRPHAHARMQYHYLQNSVRKRKRFSKWAKKNDTSALEAVKRHYGYSSQKAEEALYILSEEQIEHLIAIYKGGSE